MPCRQSHQDALPGVEKEEPCTAVAFVVVTSACSVFLLRPWPTHGYSANSDIPFYRRVSTTACYFMKNVCSSVLISLLLFRSLKR